MDHNINVTLTPDQIETLCRYYDEDPKQMEEYEVAELLDRLIDEIYMKMDEDE